MWKVKLGRLFNGCGESTPFLKPEHLDSFAPSPVDVPKWCFVMSKMSGLPLAGEISCWPIKWTVVALHCPGKVYIETPGALVEATVATNMADLIKEVKEEETEIEIDTLNLRQQASSANQRKRKNTEKSDGSDSQKVRLPYSCSSSSSPTRDSPCRSLPGTNPYSMHTRSLKVLPILLH